MASPPETTDEEAPCPATFRIPKAAPDGVYGRVMTVVARRMWGEVPDNAYVLLHHKPVTQGGLRLRAEGRARWNALDPHLKTYAAAGQRRAIGCSWCLDFGYFLAHTDGPRPGEGARGAALARVGRLHRPRARRDGVRRGDDRDPAGRSPTRWWPTSTRQLGHAALVELTMMVAVENERSRFNAALGLASQGFSRRAASCRSP